jgi:hypothetical protein
LAERELLLSRHTDSSPAPGSSERSSRVLFLAQSYTGSLCSRERRAVNRPNQTHLEESVARSFSARARLRAAAD